MPNPTDPHARRVAVLSAVIALAALSVAALVTQRLDATREALQTAKASCSGLVRASLEEGAPGSPDDDERDDVRSDSTNGGRNADSGQVGDEEHVLEGTTGP
jgi:hypothetical protein